MEPRQHKLKNDSALLIREVVLDDTRAILGYLQSIGGESDFLTFGPGEFELTVEQEEEFIRNHIESDNQLFIFGSCTFYNKGHITIMSIGWVRPPHHD